MDTKNVEDVYPLSRRQETFFREAGGPSRAAAACGLLAASYEDLDRETLVLAWGRAFERHPLLRTGFVWKRTKRPLQVVQREVPPPLEEHAWRDSAAGEAEQRWRAVLQSERERGFNPARAPLLRLSLCHLPGNLSRLLCSYSALLLDDALAGLLLEEVRTTYEALRERREPRSEDGRAFEEYLRWLEGRDYEGARRYWQQTLEGFSGTAAPAATRPERKGETGAAAGRTWLEIGGPLADDLRALVSQAGVTPDTLLAGAWALLLGYYTGEETVAFGLSARASAPADGPPPGLREFPFNTLPVSVRLAPDTTARAWLQEQQAEHERRRPFAHASLALIRAWGALPPSTPLFESRLVLRTDGAGPACEPADAGARGESFEPAAEPLVVTVSTAPTVRLCAVFDTALYDEAAAARLLRHFWGVLEELVMRPEQRLSSVLPLGEEEARRLLAGGSETGTPYPSDRCIHQLFEAQAAATPDAPAVLCGSVRLTYGQLNARSNRLAHHLRALGVGPETPVALCCERSVEMVVALLAILKAGGAYVPLDPSYPLERLRFMLDDTGAPVLLTQEPLAERLPAHWGQLVCLDADRQEIAARSEENPENLTDPANLAYIIYTSGSTGRPKGVAVQHRGVVRLVRGTSYVEWGADEVFLQAAPLTFDASTFEVWGSLLNGARLALPESAMMLDGLGRAIEGYGVTTLWLTAGLFHLVVDEEPSSLRGVRQLLAGGDVLSAEHVRRMLAGLDEGGRLVNGYGPTESTTFTCCHVMTRALSVGQSVPIGRPIANTQVFLVNPRMQPVPVGVPGELYIGGDGLARGYLGRPALTAEKFIPHPFSKEPGARLYRTGDLARYLPGGDIEFLGRLDQQVKVRGFRIEPGEVEAALAAHPAVRQCVALAHADGPAEKQLVAYVTLEEGRTLDAVEARSYLRERLPEYMVPSQFVVLCSFPLTPNGKIDRRALPAPEEVRAGARKEFVAPQTAGERVLAEIWQQVLGVERVGLDESFFDLGGDSILSIQVRALALKRGYELTIGQIFQHQTIAALAREMKVAEGGAKRDSPPAQPFSLVTAEDRGRLPPGVEDAYPLSMLQEGMLFHSELNRRSGVYHDIFSFRVRAPLCLKALEAAVQHLASRHPVLRTSFALHGYGGPLQLVHQAAAVPLAVTDLSELSPHEQERALGAWMEEEKLRDFAWEEPPLMRFHVFPRGAGDFQLALSFHHAIMDGWSLSTMLTELFRLYFTLRGGATLPEEFSAPLETTYRDFIALERRALESDEAGAYWARELASAGATALPPRDAPAPPAPEQRMSRVVFDAEIVGGLKSVARLAGSPLKSVLLAAHMRVLGLLSGEQEVVTGLVFNGRPEEADGERVLGLFLNTLPLALKLSGGSWVDLIQAAARAEGEMMPLRHYPLAALQRKLGRQPLFEAVFNYVHFHVLQGARGVPDVEIVGEAGFTRTNFPFLVNLELDPVTSELNLLIEYNDGRLSAAQIEAIGNYYARALAAIVRDPLAPYHHASLLGEDEWRRVVVEWNETGSKYPAAVGLQQLFEQQAERTPHAPALVDRESRLTYAELNERAGRLARHLRSLGVGAETLVGVLTPRSAEMVVALLGVLKAGGAYVPLDPAYPADRLAFMLADTRAAVLLTHTRLLDGLPEHGARVVCLDSFDWGAEGEGEGAAIEAAADSAAYVIYISGSTGRPKGVVICHRGAVALLRWAQEVFTPEETRGVLASTSVCFDLSVFELFVPLSRGGCVILAEDALRLPLLPAAPEVTLVNTVPSAMAELLRMGGVPASVRTVNLAGGPLKNALAQEVYGLGVERVWNLYGPTEDTTYSTASLVRRGAADEPTIGRPIANTRAYILDSHMQPAPVGVSGELYLAGEGLARGYLGRPVLTAERFLPDPFSPEPGARMYRTGDVGRWGVGGEIEYVGRADAQVKVGYRVEPGEVEAALCSHEGVREAAVIVAEREPGGKESIAYFVAARAGVTAEDLRSHLQRRLPHYMVPAFFVPLAAFPLTPNGKVDRKALAAQGRPETRSAEAYVAARKPLEELICDTFAHVLSLERVGVREHFFDIGGHSLLAARAVFRLRAALGHGVAMLDLFEAPTAEALAARINAARGEGEREVDEPALVARPHGDRAPASLAQQRLWFLHQLEPGSTAYNMAYALSLEGRLSLGALEQSLTEIARRHEIVRTTFASVEAQPVQVIAPPAAVSLPVLDLSALPDAERESEAQRRVRDELLTPFSLSRGPLWRAKLLRLADEEHVLLLAMHHIIMDGWSMDVLVREVAALYTAFVQGGPSPLAALPLQYADYAVWQREYLRGERLEKQLDYWRRTLDGAPPRLELPTDRPYPAKPTGCGAEHSFAVPGEVVEKLKLLVREEDATLFIGLLAAFAATLSRYSGQRDIVLGTHVAGRQRPELEPLIGFFVNTLALRLEVQGHLSFRQLVRRACEVCLGAYEHQEVPFDKLVEELQPERSLSQSPFFNALLVFQNLPRGEAALPGLRLKSLRPDSQVTKFYLTLYMSEAGGGLGGVFVYSTDVFDAPTIGRMAELLQGLLRAAVGEPDRPMGDLAFHPSEAERQLIYSFNDPLE